MPAADQGNCTISNDCCVKRVLTHGDIHFSTSEPLLFVRKPLVMVHIHLLRELGGAHE